VALAFRERRDVVERREPAELRKVYESVRGGGVIVLWVSRHVPVPIQFRVLEEKLGPITIYQLSGIVPSAEYVMEKAREVGAKYIVPVLPLSIIARLAELAPREGITVLISKMDNIAVVRSWEEAERIVNEKPEARTIATYADGLIRVFEFKQFEKLKEVKLVTEPL